MGCLFSSGAMEKAFAYNLPQKAFLHSQPQPSLNLSPLPPSSPRAKLESPFFSTPAWARSSPQASTPFSVLPWFPGASECPRAREPDSPGFLADPRTRASPSCPASQTVLPRPRSSVPGLPYPRQHEGKGGTLPAFCLPKRPVLCGGADGGPHNPTAPATLAVMMERGMAILSRTVNQNESFLHGWFCQGCFITATGEATKTSGKGKATWDINWTYVSAWILSYEHELDFWSGKML